MDRLRVAVRQRPDLGIGGAVEQEAIERDGPGSLLRLKGDEVGAGGREGEGDRLGGRGLTGAVELDAHLRRFLQRIDLQVVDDVRRQRGGRAFVRREAHRDVLGARLLDDDRHQ